MTRVSIAQFKIEPRLAIDANLGMDQGRIAALQLELDDVIERLLGIDPDGVATELLDSSRDLGDDIGTLRTLSWMISVLKPSTMRGKMLEETHRALAIRDLLMPGVVTKFHDKEGLFRLYDLMYNVLFTQDAFAPGSPLRLNYELETATWADSGPDTITVPAQIHWKTGEIVIGQHDEESPVFISPGHVAVLVEEISEFTWMTGRFQAISLLIRPDNLDLMGGQFDRESQCVLLMIAGGQVAFCSALGARPGDRLTYFHELSGLIGEPYAAQENQIMRMRQAVENTQLVEMPDDPE